MIFSKSSLISGILSSAACFLKSFIYIQGNKLCSLLVIKSNLSGCLIRLVSLKKKQRIRSFIFKADDGETHPLILSY
jgi:hypothetical protein